eukprot:jgi/Botrbrau1/1619/Bobra.0185s0034.1
MVSASPESTEGTHRSRRKPQQVLEVASAPSKGTDLSGVPTWRRAVTNIAAGATAGAAVEAVLYPLDTIKTRLQLMKSGGGFKALLQTGGGKALYAGVWGNLAGVAPASALFMAVYEPVKRYVIEALPPDKEFVGALVGGASAGLASSIVRVPTEVVKQRMQAGEFKGALQAVSQIVRKEGLHGLFAGYNSFLLRDLPFDAIEFVAYEQLKSSYKLLLPAHRDLQPLEVSVIGAVAGAITGLLTTPLDVMKTRLMTQGSSKQYSGLLDCATKIARNEGLGTFLKGWEPRVLWIGVGGSIFFTALELSKKLYAPDPKAWSPPQKGSCCGGQKS